ncbi:HD domain-containing protein [Streptomyces marispadix]|uniref:HD domain-containing protein n=1 Tax=Streptomyces marispadix TaxID=2922868 RepID=UPI003556CEEC
MSLSLGLGVATATWTAPHTGFGAGFDLVYQQDDRTTVVELKSTVRAAVALHDLGKVSAQFQMLQRAGRCNRGSHQMIQASTGAGKTHALVSLVSHFTRALRPSAAPSYSDAQRIAASIDESMEAEATSSNRVRFLWRRTVYLLGIAAGLTRAEARNVRSLLLTLVSVRSAALARRHDELNASGSRGRVYLRTALRGSSTRNAPPVSANARTLRRTGFPSLPPMSLAA